MTAFKKILTDIPKDKGIHTKTAGPKKEKYIYKYTKYYRNQNGKPRNKAKNIGKLDPTTGKMHPNNNYYTLYPNNNTQTTPTPQPPQEITIQNYGYTYIINKICQQTNLQTTLTQTFGHQNAQTIIAIASYIIQESNALDGIDDWQQKTYLPNQQTPLTSQTTSHFFTTQTETQRNKFFTNWIKTALNQGSICYDVTSISSYAKEMTSVERGYNRDNENLPQYNLGLFCDETTKTPLYYNRYNGSITDKTNLLPVLANAKNIGITHTKLILDGGFWSKSCLVGLQKYCDAYTIGMPMHLKVAQKILATYGDGVEKYQNELVGRHIYCVDVVDTLVCGVLGRVLLYYDPLNRYHLCSELSDRVERLKAELSCLKRFPKGRLGRYTPYFVLTPHSGDEGGFDYVVDTVKVEALRASKGFFMIFTTDREVSAGDVLDHYRGKDAVEKLFCQIKVELGGNRIRTHSELATDGKTFVVFVACVIRNYLLNKLLGYLVETSSSLKKAVNQLSNITLLSSQDGYRFAKALSKKQKDILSAFIESKDLDKTLTDELSTLKL